MITGVLIPVAALVLVAIYLPRLLARVTPESLAGLIVNGALSAVALTMLAAAYFLWSYARQDTRLLDLIGFAPGETLGHFLRLGLGSALIWGPVLVLSVSTLPRRWKENVW